MKAPTDIRHRSARQVAPNDSEPSPTEVIPFGRYGTGLLTAHPVGLIVVLGLLLIGLTGMPEARWFFAGALVLGGICGFFLWLRHR